MASTDVGEPFPRSGLSRWWLLDFVAQSRTAAAVGQSHLVIEIQYRRISRACERQKSRNCFSTNNTNHATSHTNPGSHEYMNGWRWALQYLVGCVVTVGLEIGSDTGSP